MRLGIAPKESENRWCDHCYNGWSKRPDYAASIEGGLPVLTMAGLYWFAKVKLQHRNLLNCHIKLSSKGGFMTAFFVAVLYGVMSPQGNPQSSYR